MPEPLRDGDFEHAVMADELLAAADEVKITDRCLAVYCAELGLEPEDFHGKTILDVGAGTSTLAVELERHPSVDAFVVSLDRAYGPPFDYDFEGQVTGENTEIPANAVVGSAEDMPFLDESFDLLVAEWSVPLYSRKLPPELYQLHLRKIFEELLRVLRPGGEARIHPIRGYLQPVCNEAALREEIAWINTSGMGRARTEVAVTWFEWERLIIQKPRGIALVS